MSIPLRHYWDLLSRYLRPQRRRVLFLALLILASTGLQLASPQIQRYFIDAARAGVAAQRLLQAALLFIGVALVQQVASVAATYFGENVAWTATNALRTDLLRHCLHLDMPFHNKRTPGEMIERIDGDVTALSNFFSQFIIQVLGNALLLAAVLVLLFREDWRVGAVLTVFVAISLALMIRLRNIVVPHWMASRQANAELFGFLEERLAGTEDIRSCGAREYVMRRFYELMRRIMQTSQKAGLISAFSINASILLFTFGNLIALAVGALMFQRGLAHHRHGLPHLQLHQPALATDPGAQPADGGPAACRRRHHPGAGATRHPQPETAPEGDRQLPPGPLAVEFDHVSFGYGEEAGGADMSLPPGAGAGARAAGRTGTGKTTLLRLLFRLYDPQQGAIRLGGVDIRQVPPSGACGAASAW